MANIYDWNRTLKFSWAHIIAFIALVFISYVVFMGLFYTNGGDFKRALIVMGLIDMVLLLLFMGAQVAKGFDHRFDRAIRWERALILLTLPTFGVMLVPYNHFWNVFDHRHEVTTLFQEGISTSKELFKAYDKYVDGRKRNLDYALSRTSLTEQEQENYKVVLDLQLSSPEIREMCSEAVAWIDHAAQSPTIWNAFLIGNVSNIESTLGDYNKRLVEASQKGFQIEPEGTKTFEATSPMQEVVKHFDALKTIYSQEDALSTHTIWTAFLLYLMLLFPYFMQQRNTKAQGFYYLRPWKMANQKRSRPVVRASAHNKEKESSIYTGTLDEIAATSSAEASAQGEKTASQDIYSGTF